MIDFTELPTEYYEYLVQLRKEAAQHRQQKNTARTQLGALRTQYTAQGAQLTEARQRIASLQLDLADAREGILPRA